MALTTQYSDRIYGNITFIGNTLGLSRRENTNTQSGQRVPGTYHIVGAFTTTDTTSRCNNVSGSPFPFGTTCDLPITTMYTKSSSEAVFTLPPNTEVVYAELIWGGSYKYASASVEANLNDPIKFKPPNYANAINIYPLAATSSNFKMGTSAELYAYTRSANVTSYVRSAQSGTYWVGNVPALISANDTESGAFGGSGWTLAIIYKYLLPGNPLRSITLYVGGIPIIAGTSYAETTLSNFVTPSIAPITGRLLISAFEGDYSLTGEQVFFATTGNSNLTTALSGPNNLSNNFFASQINNDAGLLNTQTGTFSNRNHTLNSSGTAYIGMSAGRQGWDITNIAILSSHLSTNRTSATLRISTVGESILLNGAAIVLDTQEPKIELTKSTSIINTVLGDEVLYTLVVKNVGTAQAENIMIKDTIPPGMSFIPGSVTINNSNPTIYSIINGIPLSTLWPSDPSITIKFKLKVTSTLLITNYSNTATATYTYPLQPLPYTSSSNTVIVYPVTPGIFVEKFAFPTVVGASDIIHYSIKITNTGDLPLTLVKIYDTDIPLGLVVDETSLLVDGQPPIGSLSSGITISQINKGAYSMITFNSFVSNILFAAFENTAYGTGNYTVNPGDTRPIDDLSNPTRTDSIDVSLTKTVDLPQAIENDVLTYTVILTNNSSIPIQNIILKDIIDPNTTYNVSNPIPYEQLVSGIIIPTLAASGGTYTLSFKVTINPNVRGTVINTATLDSYTYTDVNGQTHQGIPQQATAETIVQDIDVHFSKDVSPKNAKIGDTVIYTLTVTNNSSIPITDVLVKDISVDLQYVSISQVRLNEMLLTPQPILANGVSIASIEADSFATITFQATVLANAPNPIHNTSTLNYTYFNGTDPVRVTNIPSNTTALAIVIPGLLVEKFSNKSVLINNDTVQLVQYTIYVTNTGNVPINNVVITDQLPAGMIYSPHSTYIDNVGPVDDSPAPETGGIVIGTIPAAPQVNRVTILFSVEVFL